MKNIVIVAILGVSFMAAAKENESKDAKAVDAGCAKDAFLANCGNEKIGTGLGKCLRAYHKKHLEYKFTDNCAAAMETMREDLKAAKKSNSVVSKAATLKPAVKTEKK